MSDPDRSTTREQPQIKKSTKQRSIRLLTPCYNKTRYLKTTFVPKEKKAEQIEQLKQILQKENME